MRRSALKNRPFTLPLLLLCALLTGGAVNSDQAQANLEEDTQLWNDLQVAVPLSDRVDFNLFASFRFGRDVTHLVDSRAGAGFSFRANKYLSLSSWYMSIRTRPFPNRRGNETRLHFAAALRFPLGKAALSHRSLIERRLRFPLSTTRYRNRLQIDYPLKFGGLGLFGSGEVFYDSGLGEWSRTRFAAGVSRRFNKQFAGDLYYMRQNDGLSRPGDLHVIGLGYRVRL